jgi:glycosyltransferase involved in cell wall biosynthesis
MTLPLISIIVRTHNRLNLLIQALQSLMEQTYRPLEVVIINDGGVDVMSVVQSFQSAFTYLCVQQLSQQMGRAAAANSGLKLARGEFIGFLDDDDVLDANHITELYTVINQYSLQAAYTGVRVVKRDTNGNENYITEFNTPFDLEHLYAENFIPIHSMLFTRNLIVKGCYFDTDFELFEDWDFWLQLSQHTDFYFLNHITATYRLNTDSSALHSPHNRLINTIRIYTKWLANWQSIRLYQLLARMHEFRDITIAALQSYNQTKLQEIGTQHTYACKMVEERDHQLQELTQLYTHANNVVQERDHQLRELAEQYNHAMKVVNERDIQLQDFAIKHDYALQVIQEKDALIAYMQTHPIRYTLKRIYKKLQLLLKI